MAGWERVKHVVRCAYGCEVKHPEWAWWGKYPFIVCEPCAAKYGIVRPQFEHHEPEERPALVPVRTPTGFSSIAEVAEAFKESPQSVMTAARRKRR